MSVSEEPCDGQQLASVGVDLSGTWRAQAADEGLRRAFPGDELDDSGWPAVEVPGHWRSTPAFGHHDGPLLYRRRFEHASPGPDRRAWLTLEGLFYLGDVWLDGAYVGATEGYFLPHTFDVTDALRERSEHLLAVEVTCTPQTDRTAKRNITGVFQHWDCLDPDWNPGGIWRPVHLYETGPVRIDRLRTLCREATDDRAVVAFTAVLDAADATTVTVRTAIGGTDHEVEQPLAAGANKVAWTVTIAQPDLWWPHALGAQPLCDVSVDVVTETGDVSDRRRFRTGLRQVQMKRWVLSVNGERLFLKGSNQGPTRMALAEAKAVDLAADVRLAKEAGLDLLRVHGHVSRPELYDAADEAGLLLWQDMPLQWGYARGIRKQAARQAREAVDLLGHHPAIAVWCGHNEPIAIDIGHGVRLGRLVASMELPTWNKTVLDRSVGRALETTDPTRPVVAHSGVWPSLGSGGTDAHLYFGWYHGRERDLPRFLAAWPRFARFVSEFGAQAVPTSDEFMHAERWPDLDWDRLEHTHALQKSIFDRTVPPADYTAFDGWQRATQEYQATVIRHHVETLRRLKYRPAGGFAQFCFADGHPAVTWSVLDHLRSPKAGFRALQEACAPVIVVADRPAAAYAPGDPLAFDVHVVSDLRVALDDVHVQATLRWTGGEHAWEWQGDVAADSCARVATVQAVAPEVPGPLVLELELHHAQVKTSNRYETVIGGRMPA
jgi:beta-mannosidase